jgi:transposase
MLGVNVTRFFDSFQEGYQMDKGHHRSSPRFSVGKANGNVHSRVEAAGPKHFGILCIDPHKGCSKWMLSDFYGRVLVPPTELVHSRCDFQAAFSCLRQATAEHQIKDLIVAVERTGRYHLPVQHAFKNEGFEVRILHPYTTKQYRQPANQGNKTDDTDLAAMQRASVAGFGLLEPVLDPLYQKLRLWVRHRRDAIQKRSMLYCQMLDHLALFMPGFDQCFDHFWDNAVAVHLARHFSSPLEILHKGHAALGQLLDEANILYQERTLEKILAWARATHAPDPHASLHHRIYCDLDLDRQAKTQFVHTLEIEIASCLVQTPYVLLLSIPGINVVSAAEFGGEMGPISHYASPRAITGRAGIYPSRYSSHKLDLADGPLVRCAFRSLRSAIMMIADNLHSCNKYFHALAQRWKALRKNPKHERVKIACRFCRIAFHMVSARQVFQHPCCQQRDYILEKLMNFHLEHHTAFTQLRVDLQAAKSQLPTSQYAAEASPLRRKQESLRRRRGGEPKAIGEILSSIMADLAVAVSQPAASGELVPR